MFPLNSDDFETREEDQPRFTRGQNAMLVAFVIAPVSVCLIIAGYVARAHWLWILGGVIFAFGMLAPAFRAGVERRHRRRSD
jgi:Flp pilus assembly protein TadB